MRGVTERQKQALLKNGRVFSSLGLPADCDGRLPLITVTGSEYIRVENHLGLIKLTCTCIKLSTRIGVITVEGKRLAASDMRGGVMLLHGQISRISFD